jgi:hypothetical protein
MPHRRLAIVLDMIAKHGLTSGPTIVSRVTWAAGAMVAMQ